MAAFVTCLLCAVIIIKPQEFVPGLGDIPLVNLLFVVAVLCIVVDVSTMRLRPLMAPQIPLFLAFVGTALAVTLVKRPDAFLNQLYTLAIGVAAFLIVAIGASSEAGIKLFATTFLCCSLFAGGVALTQYFRPLECLLGEKDDWAMRGAYVPDGRPCETALDCRQGPDAVIGGNYICEHPGAVDTFSAGGRVRYRGSIADPNELSVVLSAAIPLGLSLAELRRRRRSSARIPKVATPTPLPPARPPQARSPKGPPLLSTAALLATTGFTVVVSQSRTGLISYLVVTGLYFIRRVGAWGVVLGCIVAPPMLLYGGRSGSEADESSAERTELLLEAFQFIRRTKGIGLGAGQFPEESSISMTAHNAYMLAAAETGLLGVLLFGTLLYISIKVPVAIWFGSHDVRPVTAALAPALAISLCGVAVGIVFLSWTYKDILYMLLGASAALYSVAKSEDPRLEVRMSGKEWVLVPLGIVGMLVVMYVGGRLRK